MLKARVKQDSRLNVVMAFVGREYVKYEYRDVPDYAVKEALRHPWLDCEQVYDPEPDELVLAADLDDLTLKQLRAMAKEKGVYRSSMRRKADLVSALRDD